MKIIVHPHELIIGGSPINAIDLAAKVRDSGHDVSIYAVRGPLEEYVRSKSLRYIPAPVFRFRPSLAHVAQLTSIAAREKVDLIHAYEWPPCLASFFGAGLLLGVPTVCTVLSMSVMSAVPRIIPLIMGTEELSKAARTTHQNLVSTIEPPVDTDGDSPNNDGSVFRAAQRVKDDELLVVTVSRLAIDLKLDALVDAIDAADLLASAEQPVRLVVVGTGEAADQLGVRAKEVNNRHGREVVTLAGPMLDPRPAYAAADVIIGMGSSVLRGLAHGKPVVVLGEAGFNAPFDPEHEPLFRTQGFYGVGDKSSGCARLSRHLTALLAKPALRASLGAWGRQIVVDRYSLRTAATRLAIIYEEAVRSRPSKAAMLAETARCARVAAEIEFQNHLPSLKRARADSERRRLLNASMSLGSSTQATPQ